MATMKRTLLDLVQDMLDELDGDQVNSIDDTIEATQIANIIGNVYWSLVSDRLVPELHELDQLEGLADSGRPNYLKLPTDVDHIPDTFEYNKSDDGEDEYRDVRWMEPMEFLRKTRSRDSSASNVTTVNDVSVVTPILVINDTMPTFFTSFDDEHIVCDSYDSAIDTTLQGTKTRIWARKVPTITISDTFEFDIDANYYPYLYNEALSRASVVLKGTAHEKAEQWARRHKNFIISRKHRIHREEKRPRYGRR